MTRQEVIDFIQAQIDWRGPAGNKQGHIVIGRKEGEQLLEWLKQDASGDVERSEAGG